MSTRGPKKRGRPPKVQVAERNKKFQYHLLKKPKYLLNYQKKDDSQFSTPSASRASSPDTRRISTRSRGHRAGKKSGATGSAYQRRNYNSAYDYHESEYHYGSDFGDDETDKSEIEDEVLSESDVDSVVGGASSDSDFSLSSFSTLSGTPKKGNLTVNRAPTPEPLWLQDRELPPLNLPKSSDDLLISHDHIMSALCIYEVLRHFRNLIRLSPFRFEDFCAAILCDDQSNLLSEIHIMLLKALLREEDSQQTHFGPLDQKDSVNIALYLIDNITYPEILRSYLESDKNFDHNVLQVLTTTDYPFTNLENRIKVLQFLTDQFLITNPVREDLLSEVPMHYDDHCRVCHKLGDLLCCETCPAVYHLECVDPPLTIVPEEDWQCGICRSHKVSGVVDCVLDVEKQGQLSRQEPLGYDRHGRKYYFLCRRIFVESQEGEVWYYTTPLQYEELVHVLDKDDMESHLFHQFEENKEEIIRQMELTQKLTKQYKGGKKTYLDAEQVVILQLIKEREEKEQDPDKINNENPSEDGNEVTESEKDNNECDDNNESNNKGIKLRSGAPTTPRHIDDDSRITRFKSNQIANGTYLFKLGMENSFKSYVNQFTTNIIALNKPQRNEERDKKRHLSHKFSLTPASEFKWAGGSNGTCALLTNTLKNTILQLEQILPTPFMHPNWHLVRKHWLNIVGSCQKPRDFAKALIVLQACIKPVCFANVWHDQLGHTKLVRITVQEREERKKLEKREKKDREEEEERNRLIISSYIKYTMTFKHQLWKQKGEEYRMHGRWGWLWMRIPRGFRHVDSKKLGLSGDPQRFMLQIKDVAGLKKIVSLSPNMYRFLMKKLNKGGDETNEENQEISEIYKKIEESFPDILKNIEILPLLNEFEEIDVSKALTTPGRLLYPKVAKKGVLDDLLGRRLQLKILEEKKIQSTTGEQQQLKNEEEHHHEAEGDEENHSQHGEGVEKQLNNMLSGKMPVANSTPINTEFLNSVAKKINNLRSLYSATSKIAKDFKCYSKGCNSGNSHQLENICYSPLCMQRIRLRRELLTLLRKANVSSGNASLKIHLTSQTASPARKTSILEQTLKAAPSSSSSIKETETGNKSTEENFCKDLVDAVLSAESTDDELKLNAYVPVKEDLLKKEVEIQKEELEEEEKIETKQECSDLKDEETTMDIDVTTMTPPKKKRKLQDENEDLDMSDLSPNTIKEMILGSKSSVTKITTTTTTTVTSSKSRDGKIKTLDASQKTKTSVTTQSANGVSSSIQKFKSKSATYIAKKNRRFCGYKVGVKREEKIVKIERAEDGTERIYSTVSTEGKIFLKKLPNQNELRRKKRTIVKYPICSNFKVRKGLHSLLVLPPHDARKLARNAGRIQSVGYNIMAKQNNLVWPYPCARPLFKTCWLYRTVNLKSLAAAALQLRILWATLRWDDMQTKPPNTDGKHQVTTETEILSLELLKHQHVGQFLERTQYLRRKVVIPLELPKTVREVTSIRSGLRKRKRPESPQSMDPQVSEEWVDEDKLELWEIKQYGEKIEKVQQVIVTRSRTGNLPPPRPGQNNSGDGLESTGKVAVTNKATTEEIKEKMEQQLRIQRAAHQQNKRSLEGKTLNVGSTQFTASTSTSSTSTTSLENSHSTNNNPTLKPIQPKVTTADGGTLKVMKNVVVPNQAVVSGKNTLTSLLTSNNRIGARRILMTKGPDGTTRVVPGNSSSTTTTTASKTTPQQNLVKVQTGQQIVQSSTPATAASSTPTKEPQRVQIMRTPDGRITVKGLLPGQQLVQFPDGKLQVLTTTQLASAGASKITPTTTSTPLKQPQITSAVKSTTKVSTPLAGKQAQQQQQQLVLTPKIPSSVRTMSTGQLLQKFNQQQQQQQVVVGSNQVISTQGGQQVVTNQIVVNNPNLAQQLASGKVQVATVNGQQVLIRPTGNNQAQVIAQLTPGSITQTLGNNQIVQQTTTTSAMKNTPTPPQSAPSPDKPSASQSHQQQQQQQDNQIDKATMEHLLIGQPAGTVIKCVTAQVIQTQQGPRIVLQGLQGADFTPQQLAAVQQQVKQQLLKAQASTGKQGVLGPTKIYLAVQPNSPETDGTDGTVGGETTDSNPPPPLAPVESSKQEQIAPVRQQQPSSVKQDDDVETSGKVCQNLANGQQAQTSSALLQAMKTKLETNHKPQQQHQQKANNDSQQQQQHQQFVVTPDYIQQTIKTALKQENLNPEIEEKLLQLQRFQERQMKQEPECVSPVPVNARKRVCSTSKNEDVDWVMEQPKRSRLSRNTTAEIRKVESIPTIQETSAVAAAAAVISEKILSPLRARAKSKERERLSNNRAKIMVTLYRQKELLKKDILRKRALLEKDLQYEIQKEVADELAARTKIERTKQDEVRTSSSSTSTSTLTGTSKRKSAAAPAATIPAISAAVVANKPQHQTPGRPGRKPKSSQSFPHNKQNNQNKLKKEKVVYCICRTPYDETKFYVGCDLCNNWFHGDCVGITEESSKSLSEFICDECKQARETQKLYCLCRQPYDDSQFYICCDNCQDWFHGRCVGILQSEADNIDEYVCPRCQKNSSVNYVNMKELSQKDFDNLKKLIKLLQSHKSSWPFMEPVDPTEAPDYYKVIKEPMDLQMIENKINDKVYRKLSEFIGDMTKIFDNCRYYNPKESPFFKCAESLEAYFVHRIKCFRDKLYENVK